MLHLDLVLLCHNITSRLPLFLKDNSHYSRSHKRSQARKMYTLVNVGEGKNNRRGEHVIMGPQNLCVQTCFSKPQFLF